MSSPTKRQKAANAAAAAAKEAELAERLEANMNELVKLSDEKLNIATQASGSNAWVLPHCCDLVAGRWWLLHDCGPCAPPVHPPCHLSSSPPHRFTTTSTATSPSWTRTARPLTRVGAVEGRTKNRLTASRVSRIRCLPAIALLPPLHSPSHPATPAHPCAVAEIAKERQRLGLPPVEPTVGGGSVDTGGGGGKRKRKDGAGEQRKLTPEEQYQVGWGLRRVDEQAVWVV